MSMIGFVLLLAFVTEFLLAQLILKTHLPIQPIKLNFSQKVYQEKLDKSRFGIITTEIKRASKFYFAEEYHQQYLIKNPNGYCALKGTGIEM